MFENFILFARDQYIYLIKPNEEKIYVKSLRGTGKYWKQTYRYQRIILEILALSVYSIFFENL